MSKRAATGGYDPSGIDLDAWTELEEQLEALQLMPELEGQFVDTGAKFREARHVQGYRDFKLH